MAEQEHDTGDLLTVGRIASAHGIKGWVNVQSFTRPADNLLEHDCWTIDGSDVAVTQSRRSGKRIQVKLQGIDDRNQAESLKGHWIQVSRDAIAGLQDNEYLWADLIGLRVRTSEGVELGQIAGLMETGANDVLVVKGDRERLIPFDQDNVIRRVDLAEGYMEADWDPAF